MGPIFGAALGESGPDSSPGMEVGTLESDGGTGQEACLTGVDKPAESRLQPGLAAPLVFGNGTGVVWIPDCSRQDGGAEGDLVQNDTFGAEAGLEG